MGRGPCGGAQGLTTPRSALARTQAWAPGCGALGEAAAPGTGRGRGPGGVPSLAKSQSPAPGEGRRGGRAAAHWADHKAPPRGRGAGGGRAAGPEQPAQRPPCAAPPAPRSPALPHRASQGPRSPVLTYAPGLVSHDCLAGPAASPRRIGHVRSRPDLGLLLEPRLEGGPLLPPLSLTSSRFLFLFPSSLFPPPPREIWCGGALLCTWGHSSCSFKFRQGAYR